MGAGVEDANLAADAAIESDVDDSDEISDDDDDDDEEEEENGDGNAHTRVAAANAQSSTSGQLATESLENRDGGGLLAPLSPALGGRGRVRRPRLHRASQICCS